VLKHHLNGGFATAGFAHLKAKISQNGGDNHSDIRAIVNHKYILHGITAYQDSCHTVWPLYSPESGLFGRKLPIAGLFLTASGGQDRAIGQNLPTGGHLRACFENPCL
jgi:hypothetical protein